MQNNEKIKQKRVRRKPRRFISTDDERYQKKKKLKCEEAVKATFDFLRENMRV